MGHETATLEHAAKTLRSDMWGGVCEDAVLECGIAESCFGPVQANLIEALPDAPSLNTVLGAVERDAVAAGNLAAAVEWADGFDVDYRVRVPSGHDTPAAEDWLHGNGFEQARGIRSYIRDTSPPPGPGNPAITVWEIDEPDSGGETMALSAAPALGLPPAAASLLFALPAQRHWRTYTAELDGEIVSFGSMLLDGTVAWVGLDATVEEARGRGCNQVLLRERILAAGEAGCRLIVAELEESESEGIASSHRNLLRAGFVPAYRSMNWQRPRGWRMPRRAAS